MGIRILIAKIGLDGHDRGAKVMASAFRDAGMDVIYTGLRQTPERIASAAMQEDVGFIGVSILSGAHLPLCRHLISILKENGIGAKVIVGGIIPSQDIAELEVMGVSKVFGPGTFMRDAVEYVKSNS